jgi:hypothetical protein
MWGLQKFLPKQARKATEMADEVIEAEQVVAPVEVCSDGSYRSNVQIL